MSAARLALACPSLLRSGFEVARGRLIRGPGVAALGAGCAPLAFALVLLRLVDQPRVRRDVIAQVELDFLDIATISGIST